MTRSPVRIALIGLDHWYSAFPFVEAVAAHTEADLIAIADVDMDRAQMLAQRTGVTRVTTQPSELIEDSSIDVIVSFVSVDQNPGLCTAAARNGKHILSVKPLARTISEATSILTAVREAGTIFLPAESRGRLTDNNRQVKQWIAEGRLGRILTASFSLHAALPKRWPGDPDPGWFADPDRTPGGGWIDHSIYQIDLLRWLLEAEVQQIMGWVGRLKYPELPVEDYGLATVQFEHGVVASIEDTWIGPLQGFRSHMSLIGSEGALAYDSLTGQLSLTGKFPPFNGWIHTIPQTMRTHGLEHLLAIIRGEEAPVATVDDAWRNLAVCLAFYEAAAAGTVVTPASIPAHAD